jgi:ribosome maturation factor RimP
MIESGVRLNKHRMYEASTEEMVLPIINANNFELVDVEFIKEAGTYYLRIYIDKEGGITIDDCEIVSRALSDKLDEKDFIEESYILEVSSPGVGRPLKKDKDFARSIGQEVDVKLFKPIDKQKEFNGILESFNEEEITVKLDEDTVMTFKRKEIALVRLAFDF